MEKAAATDGSWCQGKIHLGLGFFFGDGPRVPLALFSHPAGGQIWASETVADERDSFPSPS